jgi:subtilisin
MDDQNIVHFTDLLIANSDGETIRYLIQFHNRLDYHQCMQYFFIQDVGRSVFDYVQFLPTIYAIRCSLSSPDCLNAFSSLFQIEEDQFIELGARFQLPTAGKPFTSADTSRRIPWGLTAIQAPKLWPKSKGQGVRIGIVDTGVDFAHPDIKSSLHRGVNILQRHQLPLDDNGHGTHIAGTLVASNVSTGIRGVAPRASLYPIKAFDRDGAAYVSDIILAIQWCLANHMNIINMSFGMSAYSPALHNAVKTAYAQDVVIVASAGNHGKLNMIDYPARFPQTIGVGATNRGNRIAAFSNQGELVDVYAPGEEIYSTWPHGQYNELSGTSMATAHVSGVIALLLTKKPKLTATRIKTILTSSAIAFTHTNKKVLPRKGRLDAVRAWIAMYRKDKLGRQIASTKARRSRVGAKRGRLES